MDVNLINSRVDFFLSNFAVSFFRDAGRTRRIPLWLKINIYLSKNALPSNLCWILLLPLRKSPVPWAETVPPFPKKSAIILFSVKPDAMDTLSTIALIAKDALFPGFVLILTATSSSVSTALSVIFTVRIIPKRNALPFLNHPMSAMAAPGVIPVH